ncbi:MAG: hypothetical protein QOK49_4830 [Baekduia sp.]|nr:hypothetical protein [Baekduia sp.]
MSRRARSCSRPFRHAADAAVRVAGCDSNCATGTAGVAGCVVSASRGRTSLRGGALRRDPPASGAMRRRSLHRLVLRPAPSGRHRERRSAVRAHRGRRPRHGAVAADPTLEAAHVGHLRDLPCQRNERRGQATRARRDRIRRPTPLTRFTHAGLGFPAGLRLRAAGHEEAAQRRRQDQGRAVRGFHRPASEGRAPVATTWFRPRALASYRALSALWSTCSGVSPG